MNFFGVVFLLEYLRGYDINGNEKLWIVTSGNVNSLALIDVNSDKKNEVLQFAFFMVTWNACLFRVHFDHL